MSVTNLNVASLIVLGPHPGGTSITTGPDFSRSSTQNAYTVSVFPVRYRLLESMRLSKIIQFCSGFPPENCCETPRRIASMLATGTISMNSDTARWKSTSPYEADTVAGIGMPSRNCKVTPSTDAASSVNRSAGISVL